MFITYNSRPPTSLLWLCSSWENRSCSTRHFHFLWQAFDTQISSMFTLAGRRVEESSSIYLVKTPKEHRPHLLPWVFQGPPANDVVAPTSPGCKTDSTAESDITVISSRWCPLVRSWCVISPKHRTVKAVPNPDACGKCWHWLGVQGAQA